MNLKLLSTVKQLRFEDTNGVVLGRIERNPRGQCVLIGYKPNFSHYQVVVYENPLRKEDKSFITVKAALTPHPGPLPVEGRGCKAAVRDTSPMRPTYTGD